MRGELITIGLTNSQSFCEHNEARLVFNLRDYGLKIVRGRLAEVVLCSRPTPIFSIIFPRPRGF